MRKLLLLPFLLLAFFVTNAQLTENFDSGVFPPTGWMNEATASTDPTFIWALAGAGSTDDGSFVVDPHSGDGMAKFDAYNYDQGSVALLTTGVVDLTTGGPHVVRFWMFRDNGYNFRDSLSVYVNTTASLTGASFLGTVQRYVAFSPAEASVGWHQYTFNIPASFNTANNYFVFKAYSDFGNSIFIDDVEVSAAPNCGTPSIGKITNYNYAGNTATVSWTAPSIGTPTSYQWAVNTTGNTPASGTAVTDTMANITGITPNVVNYVFVRTVCSGGEFSDWVSTPFAATGCATLINPVAGATDVPQNQTFTWTTVAGATEYQFFLGFTAGSEVLQGSFSGTSAIANGTFLPSTTYYWYVRPSINDISSPAVCNGQAFTTGPEPTTPANNICSGAVTITSANTSANPINGTTAGATLSIPGATCGLYTGSADDDVWYQFTTANTGGTFTITPTASGGIKDIIALVYDGDDCSNIGNLVACFDSTIDDEPEVVRIGGLSPDKHYFLRIYSFGVGATTKGAFTIVVSNGTILPISLADFTARRVGTVNELNWSTAQEINTSYFGVERSVDGRNFIQIGQVTAAGSSAAVHKYSFIDNRPSKGDNYYRLRITDKDNSAKLSEIRRVRNSGLADVSIYPNPARTTLTVSINADKAVKGQVIITDLSGKAVYNTTVQIPQGGYQLPLSVSKLSAGSYILKLQMADDVLIQKFEKQ